MKLPLQVTFRNMEPSEALEQNVREKAEKLNQYFDQIMSCRAVVESDHRKHQQGNIYRVRLDITVPGKEIVVNRNPAQHRSHEDVYVAVRDAFDAARRQLQNHVNKIKQNVKSHDVPPHGTVTSLDEDQGYGTILTSDGRYIYFHQNSLVNTDFDKVRVGDTVRFNEEMGDDGPQASSVLIEGKHHVQEKIYE